MKTTKLLLALLLASQANSLRADQPDVIQPVGVLQEWTVGLHELDLSLMDQGWGSPQTNKSVSGQPLSIGSRQFAHGVGTHANGQFALDLHGTGGRFSAWVGVDDGAQGLFVRIVPWKGDTSKILFDGITFKPVESVSGAAAGFKSIKLLPEYVAEIR